jgi:hypothetical protein
VDLGGLLVENKGPYAPNCESQVNDDEDVLPAGPKLSQSGPEQPVQRIQTGTGPFPLENRDLLSEGENFQGGGASTAEEDADHSDDSEDEFRHELPL